MPNLPNIKREILAYVLEQTDGPFEAVDLSEFAESNGYGTLRVCRKASETDVLECGVSMKYPWYEDRDAVEEKLDTYT